MRHFDIIPSPPESRLKYFKNATVPKLIVPGWRDKVDSARLHRLAGRYDNAGVNFIPQSGTNNLTTGSGSA